jgi:hypothetical protein
MVNYLNLEHSVPNVFFLKYRIKHFVSDQISAQVSSFLKDETLHSLHSRNLLTFHESLHNRTSHWSLKVLFKLQVERLERQLRILQRTRHDLNQRAKTFANRCVSCCRPFQFVLGILCMLFGLLIFISLLLTSIDKAINSQGAQSGYILQV